MGWFGKSKYLKYAKKLPTTEKQIRDDLKRCANCNRLLSKYTKKEICRSCEEQSKS